MNVELYIYNKERELAGVVESFEYLRWTRRYARCGAFEMKAIATPENLSLLRTGSHLWKSDDEEIGVIEQVELEQADRETVTVSGRFATSFLARRIVWGTETLSGDLSACVAQLMNHHLISPGDPSRHMAGIVFSSPVMGTHVNTQVSYKNLMDTVTGLCEASDRGIKTVFSPGSGLLTVTLYTGVASQAVFSHEYENLTEQSYTHSDSGYANTALIGGEGEGGSRVMAAITGDTGEARREVFVDAKDLRQEDFGTGYQDALLYRGQSKLSTLSMLSAFDAEVNPHGNLRYKTDFDLGQVVTVLSRKWGVTLTTRITEVTETYDEGGLSLGLVFGKGALTLIDKLKGG